jgi:peroxiredoxin
MKTRLLTLCTLAAVMLSTGLQATGEAPTERTGTQIGQHAPLFTLKDQNNQAVSLGEMLKKGPVALVFVRSADWCLYCKLQLIQLQRNLKTIEASGGQVVGISYDPVKVLKHFANEQAITFQLLSDVGSKTIDAYDMRNKQSNDGSANHGVIILDQKGVIRARPYLLSSQPDQHNVDILVNALKEARNVNGETKP